MPANPTTVIQVAVPAPLRRVFDYRCAAPAPPPGARVRAPFGRGRQGRDLIGVVVSNQPAEPGRRLKSVETKLDDVNLFGARLLELLVWAARYYHHPLGEALQTALPAQLRQGKALTDPDGVWCARVVGDGDGGDGDGDGDGDGHCDSVGDGEGHGDGGHGEAAAAQLARAPAQRRLYERLRGRGWVAVGALGDSRDALRNLQRRGLVEIEWRLPPGGDGGDGGDGAGDGDGDSDGEQTPPADASPVTLNPQQQAAVEAICGRNFDDGDHGIDGDRDIDGDGDGDRDLDGDGDGDRDLDGDGDGDGDGDRDIARARLTMRGRDGEGDRDHDGDRDHNKTVAGKTAFASFLLHGITGSGKTEVYLAVAKRCIDAGRQALILVPEIALTPQLVARVRARLGRGVCVLHSGLPTDARYRAWWRARAGRAVAVLGTRSAIFTPLKSPGLIIVDEEHDISYKQQDGFRYHARDIAIKRASLEGVPVVLGSATPSMETRHNAARGRHRRLPLDRRGRDSALPRITLLDAKRHRPADGLSAPLLRAIDARLMRGEQSIIFLNRRGFAPTAQCAQCGWQAACERCDARLTYHRGRGRGGEDGDRGRGGEDGARGRGGEDGDRGRGGEDDAAQFRCHHCGRVEPARADCPECGHSLLLIGAGTQRLERKLRARFPQARICRLDRDRVRSQAQLEDALRAIRDGATDIIIGTQLIAKGHDFARVTLVGVVNADQGLYSADFRAPEYLFQQLTQVSGRAGRAAAPGEVLVQTAHPSHPTLQTMRRHDFERFARVLLDERRLADCPPFSRLALWRAESTEAGAAVEFLRHAASVGRHLARGPFEAVQIMDAVVSPMEKRAGRYRAQLLVKSAERGPLHRLLDEWIAAIETDPKSRRARWSIDIDPMEMF